MITKLLKHLIGSWSIRLITWNAEALQCSSIDFDAWEDVEADPPIKHPIRFALGNLIDAILTPLWQWSFLGSDEELQLALDGDIPEEEWGDALRQRVAQELQGREDEFYDHAE